MELTSLERKTIRALYKVGALVEVLCGAGNCDRSQLVGAQAFLLRVLRFLRHLEPRFASTLRFAAMLSSYRRPPKPLFVQAVESRCPPMECTDLPWYAVPTIREYFQGAVKYHRLATPLLSMSWREEGDYVSWTFR